MVRTYNFEVGPVVEQFDRILQMEFAGGAAPTQGGVIGSPDRIVSLPLVMGELASGPQSAFLRQLADHPRLLPNFNCAMPVKHFSRFRERLDIGFAVKVCGPVDKPILSNIVDPIIGHKRLLPAHGREMALPSATDARDSPAIADLRKIPQIRDKVKGHSRHAKRN
jgi:hypothetical protein